MTTTEIRATAAPTTREPSVLAFVQLELANAIAELDKARQRIRYTPLISPEYAAQYEACRDAHYDMMEAKEAVRTELFLVRESDYATRKFEAARLEN